MKKRQGLVIFAGGLPGDLGLAFSSDGPLLVGVVFFPSSSLMGVMLFPLSDDGSVLGNASGEGDVLKEELLVLLSPFSPLFPSLLSLSLLSSHFPSRSHSLFFSFSSFFSFS